MNSTYLSSDRAPSNLYTLFIYLYFQIPRKTSFYNFSSPLPDTSPLLYECCLSNLIVLILLIFIQVSFSSTAWHQEYSCSSSRIQLLHLKNTAAPPQEYSCSSSRISRLRDRGNIDLLLSTVLGIRIRPMFLRNGLFCWFKHIFLRQCWGSGSGSGTRSARSACFWASGSGSICQRYESGSFPFLINVLSRRKKCLQNKNLTQNFQQINSIFKSLIGSGSGVGSGSVSQRYGSGDPDPPKNVTDPQHYLAAK